MASFQSFREIREHRLSLEVGTIRKQGDLPIALVYPSPYPVGMSSLGFQVIYRELNALPGVSAERAFLPDRAPTARSADAVPAARQHRGSLSTYESMRPVGDFPVIAFSLAYELELGGVVDCLDLCGIPVLTRERQPDWDRHPLVVMGGPLTFSNPVPAGPYADVIVLGEAEVAVADLCDEIRAGGTRAALLDRLARRPGFYVPHLHGETPPPIVAVPDQRLPATSQIRTPDTELRDMFLVEPERGCHRGCTYCVMRRSTNGGMRLVDPDKVLALIPGDARRVGLVGAAVTDHPGIKKIVRGVVDGGREIGISSLRADRLDDELLGLLRRGGYRTLTTASDGASQRLRDGIDRKTSERHLLRAAALARRHGFAALKIYMMLGLPGETAADVDELVRFSKVLAAAGPRLRIGVAPFVAKRATPLDGEPFDEIRALEDKLARLRSALRGCAEVKPTSPRWAWVEYRLAQGGFAAGEAAARATRAGGRFSDWKRALAAVPAPPARSATSTSAPARIVRLTQAAVVRPVA